LTPAAEFQAKFGNHPNYLKADSIAALATQLGVPAANLEETVSRYNVAVDEQRDEVFGRQFLIRRIEKPPFYAIRACGITVLSPAGLAVDAELRVLDDAGAPIPNLYAAGEILGFGRTSGNAFVGGLSLTPALTFGKLLGERLLKW
jgi:fumarate reductase flavoprotein subunit